MKRELSRLPNRAAKNQKSYERRATAEREQSRILEAAMTPIIKEQGAALVIEPKDSEKESHVTDPGGDERFFCGSRRARPFNPKPDQQIGRKPNQFPKNKKQKQAVGDDDAEHRAREEREISEEARKIPVFSHVADAENENAKSDQRDHHQHRGRERIENEPKPQILFAEREPG